MNKFQFFNLNTKKRGITSKESGVPGWTRTNDPLVNSQML